MLTIRLADSDHFQDSRNEWTRLVLSMRMPSIFCTWEWIDSWRRSFGAAYKLLFLYIYEKNELIGILPFALKLMKIEDGVVPGRAITFCGSNELHPDHMDIIAAEVKAGLCAKAALDYLFSDLRSWDVMHLSHLSENSVLLDYIRANSDAYSTGIQQVSIAPFIPTNQFAFEFEKYLMSLSRNKRHDLRRRNKKLTIEEGIRYETDDPFANPDCISTLFALHKRRADSKMIETTFQGKQLQEFHEDIARSFHQNGWLAMRVLKKENRTVASLYCFTFAGKVFAYQCGIEPAWEPKGVGSVVIFNLLEESFRTRLMEFDFLRGGEDYKGTWTNHSRNQYTVNIFNSSMAGRIMHDTAKMRSVAKKWVTG